MENFMYDISIELLGAVAFTFLITLDYKECYQKIKENWRIIYQFLKTFFNKRD
jgi:hypothetical protein